MTTPSQAANAHGAQMAKYFTLNQPPHVAIDSAVSVVRPELAITRLIARSGIPERTASIPAEKAYVVSVHLNHANSGEWELWTDEKYTKTGAWPGGGVAMFTSNRIRVFETRVPSTGSISMFPGPLSMPLRTMQECVRLNASTVFMELPTPFSTT